MPVSSLGATVARIQQRVYYVTVGPIIGLETVPQEEEMLILKCSKTQSIVQPLR